MLECREQTQPFVKYLDYFHATATTNNNNINDNNHLTREPGAALSYLLIHGVRRRMMEYTFL